MHRYVLVNEDNYLFFEHIINKMLADGWHVQGGVAVHMNNGYVYYTQAMVTSWKTDKTVEYYK